MITNNETLTRIRQKDEIDRLRKENEKLKDKLRAYNDSLIETIEYVAQRSSSTHKAVYMKMIDDLKRDVFITGG